MSCVQNSMILSRPRLHHTKGRNSHLISDPIDSTMRNPSIRVLEGPVGATKACPCGTAATASTAALVAVMTLLPNVMMAAERLVVGVQEIVSSCSIDDIFPASSTCDTLLVEDNRGWNTAVRRCRELLLSLW